jgi:hypothetical protein
MKVSTRNTLIASALAVGLLATGIVVIPQFITAPVVRTDASVAARATARVCPEAVTPRRPGRTASRATRPAQVRLVLARRLSWAPRASARRVGRPRRAR